MQKRIGLIIFLLTVALSGRAQENLSFQEVDKTSYELFLQGKWAELIEYSNQARRKGIDFFYLQARTGIAFYNLKKYRTATEWFLKSWQSDQSFEWLQEYLFYSLIFSGREHEAYRAASRFTPAMQQKTGFSPRKITRAALEAGFSFNPEYKKMNTAPHDLEADIGSSGYGEAFYLKNYHFESFDISHRIAPGATMSHNITYIGVNRKERIDWGGNSTYPLNINQFQYFLNATLVPFKKLYLSPSASIVWGNGDLFIGRLNNNLEKRYTSNPYNYSDLIFSASTWFHSGNFSPGAEISLADINDERFIQPSAWLTVYPLSSLNFYFTPRIYFRSGPGNRFDYNTLSFSGGFQAGPVHFYGQYLNGKMKNFIESAGYIVSNFPGTSKQKISGSVYIPAGKNYRFVLRWISQDVTESYQVYENGTKSHAIDYSYMKHTLTAGISWNF